MKKMLYSPTSLVATIVLLLMLVWMIFSAQISFGRYMTSFGGELGFVFSSKQTLELTLGEWSKESGRQSMIISISNAKGVAEQGSAVRIRLYIPKNKDISEVRMNIGGRQYTASVTAVPEGTAVNKMYGDGSICRFLGDGKEELYFEFEGSTSENLGAKIILIADAPVDTTGIEVMVEPINSERKGGN